MPEKSINAVFKHAKLGKGFVFSKNNQKRIFLPPKKALREFAPPHLPAINRSLDKAPGDPLEATARCMVFSAAIQSADSCDVDQGTS